MLGRLCFLLLPLVSGSAAYQISTANINHDLIEETKERVSRLSSQRFLLRRATTVFYDDFTSGHIDPHRWSHDSTTQGLGAMHIVSPGPENSYVRNNVLYIKPTLTADKFGENFMQHGTLDVRREWGSCTSSACVAHGPDEIAPVMSALIRSKTSFKYGKVEVVAKMPVGDWIWPAIWLMPSKPFAYGGWPASGEIDIFENSGNGNLHAGYYQYGGGSGSYGVDCMFSTLHFGPNRDGHARPGGKHCLPGHHYGQAFHKFWLDWTEDHIRIGFDEHTVFVQSTPQQGFWQQSGLAAHGGHNIWADGGKNAPYDQPFYLILDVAVAGNFFWKGMHNEPYPIPWTIGGQHTLQEFWAAKHLWYPTWHGEQAAMKIQSVKIQQY